MVSNTPFINNSCRFSMRINHAVKQWNSFIIHPHNRKCFTSVWSLSNCLFQPASLSDVYLLMSENGGNWTLTSCVDEGISEDVVDNSDPVRIRKKFKRGLPSGLMPFSIMSIYTVKEYYTVINQHFIVSLQCWFFTVNKSIDITWQQQWWT